MWKEDLRRTFYLLKSETLPLRETPPKTRLSLFDQRSYSQHGTMWQRADTGKRLHTDKTQNLGTDSIWELGLSRDGPHGRRWKHDTREEDEEDARSSDSSLNILTFCWIFISRYGVVRKLNKDSFQSPQLLHTLVGLQLRSAYNKLEQIPKVCWRETTKHLKCERKNDYDAKKTWMW